MNKSTFQKVKKQVLNTFAILTVCVCFAGFCEDSALPINVSKTMENEFTFELTDQFEGEIEELEEVNPQEVQEFQDHKESIKEYTINKVEYQLVEVTGLENIVYADAFIQYTPTSNVQWQGDIPSPIDESKVLTIASIKDLIKLSSGKHELTLPSNAKSSIIDLLNNEQPFYFYISANAKTTGPASIKVKVFLDITAKTEQEL